MDIKETAINSKGHSLTLAISALKFQICW